MITSGLCFDATLVMIVYGHTQIAIWKQFGHYLCSCQMDAHNEELGLIVDACHFVKSSLDVIMLCALSCTVIHPSSEIRPLLYIPSLILVVPNIWYRRLCTQLHLADRPAVSQESKDVVRIDVRQFIMLIPWPKKELQVVQKTARPDVYSAVTLVVLVPGFAFFRPYTGLPHN